MERKSGYRVAAIHSGSLIVFRSLFPSRPLPTPRPRGPLKPSAWSSRKKGNWNAAEPEAEGAARWRKEERRTGRPSSGAAAAEARGWRPCGCWSCTAAWAACTTRWEVRAHRASLSIFAHWGWSEHRRREGAERRDARGWRCGADTVGRTLWGGLRLSWKLLLRAALSTPPDADSLLAPSLVRGAAHGASKGSFGSWDSQGSKSNSKGIKGASSPPGAKPPF